MTSNAKGSTDCSERIIRRQRLFCFSPIFDLFSFSSPFAWILMIWVLFLKEALSPQPYTRECHFAICLACLKGRSHQYFLEHEMLLKIIVNVKHLLTEENADQNYAMWVLCGARAWLIIQPFSANSCQKGSQYEAGCFPSQLDFSLGINNP